MDWTVIITTLIGSLATGLLAVIATLKWTAQKSKFEAKNTEVDYAKNMMETQVEFIVKPLKDEIKNLRRDMRNLQHAIERVGECSYKEQCPVINEVNNQKNKGK